jgi:hypothetical protein
MRALVLAAAAAVGQVAGGEDGLGGDSAGEAGERLLDLRVFVCTDVEIGNVQDACGHERMRVCQTRTGHQLCPTPASITIQL